MARRRKNGTGLAMDVAGLSELSLDELRSTWSDLYGVEPLPRISRELLVRGVAYRLQEEREGGLSRKAQRSLDRALAEPQRGSTRTLVSSADLRPGTRLVREWQGRVHVVIVLEEDYLWQGGRYRSLSEIARLITSARWSGPRFFGTRAIDAKRSRATAGAGTHV